MKNKHPLAINILKIQEYDFSKTKLDEVVFFEWLVIKRISFGTDTFYYQQRRITEEIGIKRTRLETIRTTFLGYGLVIEHSIIYNTVNYTVSLEFIKKFIDAGVKKEFQKPKFLNLGKLHFNTEKPISKNERKKIDDLISRLNDLFNKRRKIYSDKNDEIEYTYSSLPINEKSYKYLLRLKSVYDNETIENGFTSYCDNVIMFKDRIVKSNMINHFSSYDLFSKKFPVFEKYLFSFNQDYSIKK
jgi:hypothetical protein